MNTCQTKKFNLLAVGPTIKYKKQIKKFPYQPSGIFSVIDLNGFEMIKKN